MGIKQSELVYPGSTGPTPISPAGKADLSKFFQVTRTDTVASVKARIPAQSSVISVYLFGSSVSNAATTATITITLTNNSGTISTGTYDVKTNGATSGFFNMTALPNIEGFPNNGDISVNAVYAETGAASSSGGPWVCRILWV